MGRILWVNPVGTDAFDAETVAVVERVRSPGHELVVRSLEAGMPTHLEYHLHEHAVFAPMLELMREAQADGFDAAVIGCFYDGGLRELREALDLPVVGMAEASMLFACSLGHRFSILVGRRKWIPKMRDNAITVGIERRIASFRSLEMSIPEMFEDPAGLDRRAIEQSLQAVEDGAELVLFSELVPATLRERAAAELPVPLLDPGVACWKWAEMAADIYRRTGLGHGRAFGYEAPPA
ncbi:MAG TPA: aspartate/glutamate racemase family protein [Solirubrobacterales bacterium]|nr:aspartate/glutamate racemase family protein [Solirubrobacterales bacterium]